MLLQVERMLESVQVDCQPQWFWCWKVVGFFFKESENVAVKCVCLWCRGARSQLGAPLLVEG